MKNTLILVLLITTLQVVSQTNSCENSIIHFDKFFGDLSSFKDAKIVFDEPIRKAVFGFSTDSGGKKAVVVNIIGASGDEQQPDYFLKLIFPKSKLRKGEIVKIQLIDNWNTKGLDSEESAIVQFHNLHNWGAQWSNWGGHIIGQSEGEISVKLLDEKTLCGSVTFKTYADGSSMHKDYYTSGVVKSFVATKIE